LELSLGEDGSWDPVDAAENVFSFKISNTIIIYVSITEIQNY